MTADSDRVVQESPTADTVRLAQLGYRQELSRRLNLVENVAIAFCYMSPVVGIYSLFVLGIGSGGPRYLWLLPIVLAGQVLVALVFAELASHFPVAGALYQWAKNLVGPRYGWWVGWLYGWALIMALASVDTGFVIYAGPLLNQLFHLGIVPSDPNEILVFTVVLIAVQLVANTVGVKVLGRVSLVGAFVELLGTFGIAVLLAVAGFHHGLDYLFTTQGAEAASGNALGADFGDRWWLGAALIAILAQAYVFYGFESAGDVAEEVVQSSRRVPRAIVGSVLAAGLTSFILVAALILATPAASDGIARTVAGGVPSLISGNVSSVAIQDVALGVVCFAFFSCGLTIQAAAARVIFSYSRDRGLPGGTALAKVSPAFRTPVNALTVAAVIPILLALLARFTASSTITIGFMTIPANVNALFLLVSFAVSGIYLCFLLVLVAALIARLRGWTARGVFRLGAWAYPVLIAGIVWLAAVLVDILLPSGTTSPRGAFFNDDWMTLLVVAVIVILGAVFMAIVRPGRRLQRAPADGATPAPDGATA